MAVDVLPNPGDPQIFTRRVETSVISSEYSLTSSSLPVNKGTGLGTCDLGNVSRKNESTLLKVLKKLI